ncbi:MAG: A24 family peptidase [Gallionellaceae bacterium]|jgi:leader peptidase (prepilin peptidase)/N-methyltransferase|nr:A24 family peptidase [Gallionellaceae bacterium]
MLSFLQFSPPAFIGLCALAGLLVGSFLNVVIHRLPKMMERDWRAQCAELQGAEPPIMPRYNLVLPPSACPHCERRIGVLENIPLVSYLVLRGKCKGCGARISPRYPLVEAASALLAAAVAWHFGFGTAALAALPFVWALIALTVIDYETRLLPDAITLPLLWLGLLVNLFSVYADTRSAVIGAAMGYLALWSVYWLFKLATGKEGMGYGDFKLLAAIGAWLGWQALPLVILLSALVGIVAGLFLIIARRQGRHVPIPFGPCLAGAGMVALFWGPMLTQGYLAFIQP